MMTATEPRFLYPQSRQFPFDEVCEQIVRALEERNWNVPGITVDFDVYGTGDEKYRMVRYIRGDDFKLWFCRPQANMGRWNDTAAVTEIVIPKKELRVYDEESGPTFYVYVGGNWEKDKDRFINGSKVNSKLNGEPRTYLKYDGSYEQPIVLVNRELGFDEVELVSGPWPECQYVTLIANRSPEVRELLEQALSAQEAYYHGFGDDTLQAYNDAVAKLASHFVGDQELAQAAEAYSRHSFRKVEMDAHFIERIVSSAGEARRFGLF